MRLLTMALVTGGALFVGGTTGEMAAWLPSAGAPAALAAPAADPALRELPPAPWSAADPADSLYRLAREALGGSDYARAASLFRRIHEEFPRSEYAADSYYWEAFALYRRGGSDDLRQAQTALDEQRRRFPRAGTRGDADALRARIVGARARGGNAEAAESLVKGADDAATSCPDEDDDERIAALNALLQMDEERAVPIIEKVLARRDECSVALRRKAVFLLAQKQDRNTEDALLRVVNTDPDADVREQAVFWLSQVQTDRAVEVLEQLLSSATEQGIREKAIFALSQQMRNPRAAGSLRRLAGESGAPAELREKAIFWLGQQRSGENAQFLRELYGRLDDEELKEKVIFSISQMGGDESRRWLMTVATDGDEPIEMRKKALFWVGQSNGGTELDELFDLYGRMSEREMKEQLIFVYSQRRETKAVDKLMEIARTEQDRELRKKAVFWLSQSRDPRVADFLLEVINQ
ncbi:MAG TPA: HEAT repeat domain-containing protein [Gemmatimonadaceae bacterium]